MRAESTAWFGGSESSRYEKLVKDLWGEEQACVEQEQE